MNKQHSECIASLEKILDEKNKRINDILNERLALLVELNNLRFVVSELQELLDNLKEQ